jgi:hypothetical protein
LLQGEINFRVVRSRLFPAAVATALICVGALSACSSNAGGGTTHPSTSSAPAGTSSGTPQRTTEVPAPTPGSIHSTESTQTATTLPTVAISESAKPAKGVSVRLVKITPVHATATQPGEASGPAAQIEISIENGTTHAVDVSSADVELTDSAGNAGVPVTTAATSLFQGDLAAGDAATGVYVFRLPANRRNPVVVRVTYTAGAPVAGFTGKIR